mgnify:CR=1 FL=1
MILSTSVSRLVRSLFSISISLNLSSSIKKFHFYLSSADNNTKNGKSKRPNRLKPLPGRQQFANNPMAMSDNYVSDGDEADLVHDLDYENRVLRARRTFLENKLEQLENINEVNRVTNNELSNYLMRRQKNVLPNESTTAVAKQSYTIEEIDSLMSELNIEDTSRQYFDPSRFKSDRPFRFNCSYFSLSLSISLF